MDEENGSVGGKDVTTQKERVVTVDTGGADNDNISKPVTKVAIEKN